MKKQILFLSLLASTSAFAQIEKGSMFGGLSLGFASEKSVDESKNGAVTVKGEPSKYKSYNVRPEFSYFIIDDLALGAFVGFSGNSYETTTKLNSPDRTVVTLTKNSGPTFGVFARKFWKVNDNLHTFAGFGLSMTSGKGTSTVTTTPTGGPAVEVETKSESKMSDATFSFGLAYHLSESYMLIGSFSALSFYSETRKNNILADSYDQTKNSGMNFIVDTGTIPFNLGFIYLINSKSN